MSARASAARSSVADAGGARDRSRAGHRVRPDSAARWSVAARAESAADAAALAAADRLALGDGAGAARAAAARTAASNDARLVSCDCSGTTAEVVVEVDVPAWGALVGPARGRAQAEVRPECVVDLPGVP